MTTRDEVITREEIVENWQDKIRNVYIAEVDEVRQTTIMLKLLNSTLKVVISVKDICVLRVSDLRTIFESGEIFPIVITDCKQFEEDGYFKTRFCASMLPVWGTRDDVMERVYNKPMYLPVCENRPDYGVFVALSPNYKALVDYKYCRERQSIFAEVTTLTDRCKFKLNVDIEAEATSRSRNELIKSLFKTYKREIEAMESYIDVDEFRRKHLTIAPATISHEVAKSVIPHFNPEETVIQLQKSSFRLTSAEDFIRSVVCNEDVLNTLGSASRLLYYFTPDQLFALDEKGVIDSTFIGNAKRNGVLCHSKLVTGEEKTSLYAFSKNSNYIPGVRSVKLNDQVALDATWVLRCLSVNDVLLKLYKGDHSIVETVKRNWFFAFEEEKFRALGLIERDKIIIDSVRSEGELEVMVDKLNRINNIFQGLKEEGYSVLITCRTEEIESVLRESIKSCSLPNLTIKTTNDEAFEEGGLMREVEMERSHKRESFLKKLSSLMATF